MEALRGDGDAMPPLGGVDEIFVNGWVAKGSKAPRLDIFGVGVSSGQPTDRVPLYS